MFEEGYRALLPNPLGQTVEPEMDLLTNSAMIVREGIPNYHADKDIHVLASLFTTCAKCCDSIKPCCICT
ncbi:Siderophore staphylobactin biosynthesis protein SbnE [Staphylococcus aureus]|nr:Siderophore staphylobactin biosynthesis protein SbnE [Staphylococcus aureus]